MASESQTSEMMARTIASRIGASREPPLPTGARVRYPPAYVPTRAGADTFDEPDTDEEERAPTSESLASASPAARQVAAKYHALFTAVAGALDIKRHQMFSVSNTPGLEDGSTRPDYYYFSVILEPSVYAAIDAALSRVGRPYEETLARTTRDDSFRSVLAQLAVDLYKGSKKPSEANVAARKYMIAALRR